MQLSNGRYFGSQEKIIFTNKNRRQHFKLLNYSKVTVGRKVDDLKAHSRIKLSA